MMLFLHWAAVALLLGRFRNTRFMWIESEQMKMLCYLRWIMHLKWHARDALAMLMWDSMHLTISLGIDFNGNHKNIATSNGRNGLYRSKFFSFFPRSSLSFLLKHKFKSNNSFTWQSLWCANHNVDGWWYFFCWVTTLMPKWLGWWWIGNYICARRTFMSKFNFQKWKMTVKNMHLKFTYMQQPWHAAELKFLTLLWKWTFDSSLWN